MKADFFTPVHSLRLHASPAWHHLLELVFLCGGLSPLASLWSVRCSLVHPLSANSTALAVRVKQSDAERGRRHWRAVEHQHIHLYQSGPRSLRGCPSVKHYLEGCREHRDRLGKMWTGQANSGLQWLYGL